MEQKSPASLSSQRVRPTVGTILHLLNSVLMTVTMRGLDGDLMISSEPLSSQSVQAPRDLFPEVCIAVASHLSSRVTQKVRTQPSTSSTTTTRGHIMAPRVVDISPRNNSLE